MIHRLATWSLLGALAVFPSGCAVLDATTVGFAMVSGKRLVTVSGEAKWAKPNQTITALNLATGAVLAQTSVDDAKHFSVRVSVPLEEDLAIAFHVPGSAALLLVPRGEKRQEERTLDLTRGSTTVAWALGSALGAIPLPGNEAWKAKPEQWKSLGGRLPASYGIAIQSAASTLDRVGVGSPASTAAELSNALTFSLETVRAAAGGHPRESALWPPIVLGWSNALNSMAPSLGDEMAPQAAARLDLQATLEQIWAQDPYGEGQGGLELRIPLREPGTNRLPEALPAVIGAMRYEVRASMLPSSRMAMVRRDGIRFQAGALVFRVPDLPEGFATVELELLDQNSASLGKVSAQGLVSLAMTRAIDAEALAVSLEGTPTSRPGVR